MTCPSGLRNNPRLFVASESTGCIRRRAAAGFLRPTQTAARSDKTQCPVHVPHADRDGIHNLRRRRSDKDQAQECCHPECSDVSRPFSRSHEAKTEILCCAQNDIFQSHTRSSSNFFASVSRCETPRVRNVWNCTMSFENNRSSVQSNATRNFFSNRGSLLR